MTKGEMLMRKMVLCMLMAALLAYGMAWAAAEDDIARIFAYEDGVARYANEEGKIGLVGESGDILAPAIYDEIGMFDENGLAITFREVDEASYYGLMDRNGRMVVDDRDYTYIGVGYAGYLMHCNTNRFGVYGAMGRDEQSYNIFADGSVARFPDRETLDNTNEWNRNAFFIEGSILLRARNGWRLFDTDGVPLTDDVWEACEAFPVGGGAVKKDGLWGIVDARGNLTVDCQYDWMSYTDFGVLVRARDEAGQLRWGMISPVTGEIIVPLIYDGIAALSESRMAVKADGLWGYLNEDYEWAISPRWEEAHDFSDRTALVADGSGEYLIDENGQVIVDFQAFPDGETYFSSDYIVVGDKVERTIIVLDHSGETVLTLTNATFNGEEADISDGLLPIAFWGEEQGVGFLSMETGEMALPPRWDEADNFEDGYAIVRKDGLYGVIDREGNEVIKPIYSFIHRVETVERVYFDAYIELDAVGGHGVLCEYDVLNEAGEVMSCVLTESYG